MKQYTSYLIAWIPLLIFWGLFSLFYYINTGTLFLENRKLDGFVRSHPELIPTKEVITISDWGHDTLIADMYWLRTVQYIADNLFSGWEEKKKYNEYFIKLLKTITELHPRFTEPYIIALLFSPQVLPTDTEGEKVEKQSIAQASMQIAKAGVLATCNQETIKHILQETDISQIWRNPVNHDPCVDGFIPYYLGYNYYWNNNYDTVNAVKYYKIAAAHTRENIGTQIPIATQYYIPLMEGRWWKQKTAAFVFFTMALEGVQDKENICIQETEKLLSFIQPIIQKDTLFPENTITTLIDSIQQVKKTDEEMQKKKRENPFWLTCNEHFARGTKQIYLSYLEEADIRYMKQYKKHASDARVLKESWYIPLLPVDYYSEKGIIYKYDTRKNMWDYRNGTY